MRDSEKKLKFQDLDLFSGERPRIDRPALLDADTITATAAESFRMIHLLRFGWWHDEIAGCRCARDVGVFVDAFPQERGKGFGPFIAQVLVFEPFWSPPPPTVTV